MGETHGGFECKYDVHDPKLRVEQVMDFFLRSAAAEQKKNADLFARFLRVPPWRIKRKSTLIQPNRSAGFFRFNLREPFFYTDQSRKKTLIYLRDFPYSAVADKEKKYPNSTQ
jgi:hypothetical protein